MLVILGLTWMVRCRIKSEGKIIAPFGTVTENRSWFTLDDDILGAKLAVGLVISPSVSTGTVAGKFLG